MSAALLVGPLLRHVGATDATIWVETDRPSVVEVLGHREHTWTVAGHHYAVVGIEGLEPGSATPYQVHLDGALVWPAADAPQPPSRIRTLGGDRAVEIMFGSCRYATADVVRGNRHFDSDALKGLGRRLAHTPEADWPDALLLLGDQVYADETSPATQRRIAGRRDITTGAGEQVADFEEYTWLYLESWTDPDVRWLLSTVPSSMIFDDHDVRDDWNTSHAWRVEMQATSWWQERIVGALSSYWVYQHLGNLSAAELGRTDLYQRVRAVGGADGGDAEPLLRDFAAAADREADGAKGARWSYRRDFGPVRLLMIDSRCGRILADHARAMVGPEEFDWIERQLDGDYDHLLVGTSLPWLLARALHDVESWNEAMCDGLRGERMARWSEKLRRAADLEHWASFRRSFEHLAEVLAAVGRGERTDSGRAPATVCVLSGDVHHAYVARAQLGDDVRSAVFQLTCSPLHNYVPTAMKVAFRLAWSRLAELTTRTLLGLAGRVPTTAVTWKREAGPYFGDELMSLTFTGRSARLTLDKASPSNQEADLHRVDELTLSTG